MLTALPRFLFLSVECVNYNQLDNGSIGERQNDVSVCVRVCTCHKNEVIESHTSAVNKPNNAKLSECQCYAMLMTLTRLHFSNVCDLWCFICVVIFSALKYAYCIFNTFSRMLNSNHLMIISI